MGFFGNNTAAKLIRNAGSSDQEKAIAAIAALGRMTPTPEIVDCLVAATGDAMYGQSAKSSAAIAALGQVGNPQSTDCLIRILSSGSLSAEQAAAALSHPRNDCAVGGLLGIAFEHDSYFQVRLAKETLTAIGTHEASIVLDRFRRKPARMLSVAISGYSSERISSSSLGQMPTDDEFRIAGSLLGSLNIFRFGSREEMLSAVSDCIHRPEYAQLRHLHDLFDSSDALAASKAANAVPGLRLGDLRITYMAAAPALETASHAGPARRKEVLATLQASDTGRLEAHLLKKLSTEFDREWALGLLLLLPTLRQVSAFIEAFSRSEWDARIRLAILKVLRKHALADFSRLIMEHLRQNPASEISIEAPNLIADAGLDVLEPALLLLKDDRWAARRRAIEILGAMRSDAARKALHSQLHSEQDFEMRRAIEAAIRL